ncbi:Dyp-type peroxidase [Naumannella halotolerans]|uniref:Putative iron-dependent peroxidase n=1 Tax=Naumannella halotolerans TaxID=993414 RepID=A0A4R7JD01_9ACTN|nr:Dyp-type peroxidase [Naumannella halotolerans]TDT34563.1 putative iron-dependent peroxidase [Naumannella halotolerans]
MNVQPQPVLTQLTRSAIFVTADINPGGEDKVREMVSNWGGYTRAVGFRRLDGGLAPVVGIGSHAWDRLFSGPRPMNLHPFTEIRGEKHTAPATGGDLLFHVRAVDFDLCFAFMQEVFGPLGDAVTVTDEVHGFRYFDERDLLGFVDGTENPSGEAADEYVLIGEQDPAFVGGSYVIVQKYLHDLRAWDAITVEEQERAIGRRKLSDIEFPDADKAADAHTVLNSINDENGNPLKIVRDNMPFGQASTGPYGTYFIGYAADPAVTERMLRNMFIGDPPGTSDRILDFSTAHTGALFFVPSADLLENPPSPAPSA